MRTGSEVGEPMPYILGLTGNIACGKTTVGQMLLQLGADLYVDADQIVHHLYAPGQPLVQALQQAFGPRIIDAQGGVDRRVLGDLVFRDPAKLAQLEAIVHPLVRNRLVEIMRQMPEQGIGVLDAVKLVESGYGPICHGLWLVECPPEQQLQRLMTTRGLSAAEARARIEAQTPVESKRAVATEVIVNNGSMDDLRRQVTAGWQRFKASLANEGADA
jgi:dephospho-CoA kinase